MARGARAGQLRESVVVQAESVIGEGVPTWSPVGGFRASTAPTRLGETEHVGAVRSQVTRVFTTWAKSLRQIGLKETHRLAWDGRAWNIREIRWPMGNELMCDVVADSGVGDALALETGPGPDPDEFAMLWGDETLTWGSESLVWGAA